MRGAILEGHSTAPPVWTSNTGSPHLQTSPVAETCTTGTGHPTLRQALQDPEGSKTHSLPPRQPVGASIDYKLASCLSFMLMARACLYPYFLWGPIRKENMSSLVEIFDRPDKDKELKC